jgi:hypothetical protein
MASKSQQNAAGHTQVELPAIDNALKKQGNLDLHHDVRDV